MKPSSPTLKAVSSKETELSSKISLSISRATELLLSQQYSQGFWWYTLEANESIGAEFILLLHYLNLSEAYSSLQSKLVKRILSEQRKDGSWSIYYEGPSDLSTTAECYFALKLAGNDIDSPSLKKAREFILSKGGLTQTRIFTKIHLALFGLIPWEACPAMPVTFLLAPEKSPINIYEFSSWARTCIVPILIVLEKKKVCKLTDFSLEELFIESESERNYSFQTQEGTFSLANFFIQVDRLLKLFQPYLPQTPLNEMALKKGEDWVISHIEKTEDIYPALAYGIFALTALGRSFQDPHVQKCFKALLSFQQNSEEELSALPSPAHPHPEELDPPSSFLIASNEEKKIHQQCCISPVWDTPWASMALLESGTPNHHPDLLKAARWLISKQITTTYGDWSVKNKKAEPGGWAFEFENDYFPDVDDTIEVLFLLNRVDLPRSEIAIPFQKGLDWLLSMQSKNGGWAAFDIDNTASWVNKIPFSDHGACLDIPTPDITGRMLELLGVLGYSTEHPICKKALKFIFQTQEKDGSWWGRWGVNYIYGTWAVLQGLKSIGILLDHPSIQKAVGWLKSVQNSEGGWGESCESYIKKQYVPLKYSTASQSSWALMGLIAGGEIDSKEVKKGIEFLISTQNSEGGWNEKFYTGTGFPGHFYIRYHGYRHYFPLLALGKYSKSKV